MTVPQLPGVETLAMLVLTTVSVLPLKRSTESGTGTGPPCSCTDSFSWSRCRNGFQTARRSATVNVDDLVRHSCNQRN